MVDKVRKNKEQKRNKKRRLLKQNARRKFNLKEYEKLLKDGK